MQNTHIAGVDLNVLVALDALLAEESVTRAAARVGITQPAMSRALARARAVFGDPLLVRASRGMVPTARAQALKAPLRRWLEGAETLVRGPERFDPRSARRRFVLATSDYAQAVLLPGLMRGLEREAPGIDLEVVQVPRDVGPALEDEVDFVLAPARAAAAAVVWRPVLEETFVCLLRRGHPAARRRLDLATWVNLPQISIVPEGRPGNPLDELLKARGLKRRVALKLPSFLVAPLVVARTDLVLTTARRIAEEVARGLPVRAMAPPVELGSFTLSLGWHERRAHDDAHRFLRELITRVCGHRPGAGGRRGARGGLSARAGSATIRA